MTKYFLDSPFKQQVPKITSEEYSELLKNPHHFGLESLEKNIDLLVINGDSVNKHFVISALVSGIKVVQCDGERVCGFETGSGRNIDNTAWFHSKYLDPRIKKL